MLKMTLRLRVALGSGCLAFVLGLSPVPAHAMGKPGPRHLMASMGDSISAGTFANTHHTWYESLGLLLTGGIYVRDLKSLTSVENKRSFSWASGLNVDSHFRRLERHLASSDDVFGLEVLNVAVPGSQSKDLLEQVEKVVAAAESGKYQSVKYVTILIGANDACALADHEEMRVSLRHVFARLADISQEEPVRVLVSGMPSIPKLGARDFRHARTLGIFSCDYIRSKVLKFCNPLTHWRSAEEYDARLWEVTSRNQAIRDSVEEARILHPNLQLTYTNSLEQEDFPVDLLAMDCFHPNREGQVRLSELLWNDQPWFH